MILSSKTQALLKEMEVMPLFENIGTGDGSLYEKVEPFEEALELLQYDPWVALVHEEGNKIRDRVRAVSWDRYGEWNKHVAAAARVGDDIIDLRLRDSTLPEHAKSIIRDDMIALFGYRLIETQYSDIIESPFFDGAVDVYRQGFIQCGWVGEQLPPIGRFVAF
jgi:hypothetical protein